MSSGNDENKAGGSSRRSPVDTGDNNSNKNNMNNYNVDNSQNMDVDISDMVRNYRSEQDDELTKKETCDLSKPQFSSEKRCATRERVSAACFLVLHFID